MLSNTLHKTERLDKKKVIDKMFSGGARSFSVFPLRVVYLPVEELEAPVSILVSVSKRRFKRAVKRNRVKRQRRIGKTSTDYCRRSRIRSSNLLWLSFISPTG